MKNNKIHGFKVVSKLNKGKPAWFAWRYISGKMRWVYIGKDKEAAEEKIVAWCKKYGLENTLEPPRVMQAKHESDSIKILELKVSMLEKTVLEQDKTIEALRCELSVEIKPVPPKKILGFRLCLDARGNWQAYRTHNKRKIKIGLGKSLDGATHKIKDYCRRKSFALTDSGQIADHQVI
jgi:hypothetical protein